MLIMALPGNERLAGELAAAAGVEIGTVETRRFPDGESYVRLRTGVEGRDVVLVCTLAHPDEQFLRLIFTARAARSLGARSVTLAAPYLSYMRQDKAFNDGEAVTSEGFASLVSDAFDRLITIDPHLHRHASLAELYLIQAVSLHAAPLLKAWIGANVSNPLIVGPDAESQQWVDAITGDGTSVVLKKERHGDRNVEIAFPALDQWRGRQPVLVDDIASSARTLTMACQGLVARGFAKPICVIVHPIFADDSFERLSQAAARVVSTDTIIHESNAITVVDLLAAHLRQPG